MKGSQQKQWFLRSACRGIAGALALAVTVLVPAAPARSQTEVRPPSAPSLLPTGTPVVVALSERLQSGQAHAGAAVRYTVAQDVVVGGVVLIPVGTPAQGAVTVSRGAGAFGRAGRLSIVCDAVILSSGVRVPLRQQKSTDSVGHSSADTAGAAAGIVGLAVGATTYAGVDVGTNLFNDHPNRTAPTLAGLGAGIVSGLLVGSLFHGGNVTLPAGHRLELVVASDTLLPPVSTR